MLKRLQSPMLRIIRLLTTCAVLFGAPCCARGLLHEGRIDSARVAMGVPANRAPAAARSSLLLTGDVGGFESPEDQPAPKPIRLPRGWNYALIAVITLLAAVAVVLYVGQLVILGWAMDLLSALDDFLSHLGMPKRIAQPDPLEHEQVGEIVVVTLRNNIATLRQCQIVQKQLKRLVDEHHCDFVLDFSCADRISQSFREVVFQLIKAARREASRLRLPQQPIPLPRRNMFQRFTDRQGALEAMSKQAGHGWVVLCSVPVGIRAFS